MSFVTLCSLLGNVDVCSDNRTIYLNDPDVPRCPKASWVIMTLFLIYILITSIMLMNLLIAIFRLCFFRACFRGATIHFKHDTFLQVPVF